MIGRKFKNIYAQSVPIVCVMFLLDRNVLDYWGLVRRVKYRMAKE